MGRFRVSTSPTRTFEASAPVGIFFMKWRSTWKSKEPLRTWEPLPQTSITLLMPYIHMSFYDLTSFLTCFIWSLQELCKVDKRFFLFCFLIKQLRPRQGKLTSSGQELLGENLNQVLWSESIIPCFLKENCFWSSRSNFPHFKILECFVRGSSFYKAPCLMSRDMTWHYLGFRKIMSRVD